MPTKQPTANKTSTPKKTLLAEVVLQISKAVPALNALLGEKKFEKRIKKAAKLLIEGIKASEPTVAVKKSPSVPAPIAAVEAKKLTPKKKLIKAAPAKKVIKKTS